MGRRRASTRQEVVTEARRDFASTRLFAACCRFNTVRGSALSSQLSDQIERSLSHPTKDVFVDCDEGSEVPRSCIS
eukprot:scaffold6588_cov191-Pinguiococcus_pyrenoidosus.AAC.1